MFIILPLTVTVCMLGSSCLDSLSGNGLFLFLVSVSFSHKCGQKILKDHGYWAKMFCGVPVATQSCCWSRRLLVIIVAILISFASIIFSILNLRIIGAGIKDRMKTS